MQRGLMALAVSACAVAAAAARADGAELIYGTTPQTPPHVVSFSSDAADTYTSNRTIVGLASNTILGIDVRPSDGRLYAVTRDPALVARLWTIDPASGAATLVAPLTADPSDSTQEFTGTLGGTGWAVDFNPVADRLRVITSTDQNLRVNPANGFTTTDGDINPGAVSLVSATYSNNDVDPATGTTLSGYNIAGDTLGDVSPPNNGTFGSANSSGIASTQAAWSNLDTSRLGITYGNHRITSPALFDRFYAISPGSGLHEGLANLPGPLNGLSAAVPNRFSVTHESLRAREGAGAAEVTVVRSNPTAGGAKVSVATSAGTATSGDDFTPVSVVLDFAPGETVRTIDVPISDDTANERDENFTVALTVAPSDPALAVTPASATLVIVDDDAAPGPGGGDGGGGGAGGDGTGGGGAGGGGPAPDRDGDGKPDATDNCPNVVNADQADGDGDGLGTLCDPTEATPLAPGRCANAKVGTASDESLTGTAAGDRLTGAGGLDSLFGGDGDDCLDGGAGDDWLTGGNGVDELRGGAGNDIVRGGAGADTLFGDAGNDTLDGGTGNDQIATGAGVNVVKAGAGNDTVNTKNKKRDTVDCGAGRDTVTADRVDKLKGCEKKKRR